MEKFQRHSFKRFFAILLASELVTVLMAGLLLNLGIKIWIHRRARGLLNIAVTVAGRYDWSHVDEIKNGKFDPVVYAKYRKTIQGLNAEYFPGQNGNIEIFRVANGEEYTLISDDPDSSVVNNGKPEPIDLELYASGKPTCTTVPYTDPRGIYTTDLEGDAPITRNGAIIAFVSVSADASPIQDLKGIVGTAFWWSILPAFLVALLVAFFLASRFVEPLQFLRQVQEAKQASPPFQGPAHPGWGNLSPREREVSLFVSQALENNEIAEKMSISQETVKKHLKNIFQKLEISSRISLVLIALKENPTGSSSENIPQKG